MMREQILESLKGRSERVVQWQRALTAFPALGPENDGIGEEAKASYILAELARMGVTDVRRMDAPDPRVPSGHRPNIAARIPGKSSRTLWILSHMDVVPPGEASLWQADPWTLRVEGDTLIGRGVEDNQQAIVASLLLAAELMEHKVVPELSLGLLFVADEETGNAYGMEYVLREHGQIFHRDDMFLVPDFGVPDGSKVEVAEKHVLWLQFVVEGKQCHGSMPHKGCNAMLAGSDLALRLHRELHLAFPARDELFDPPASTFTPTKREANVPNVNTVPGRDVLYVDCRILPEYNIDAVIAKARTIAEAVAQEHKTPVTCHTVQRHDSAPATPTNSPVTLALTRAIAAVHGIKAQPMGVGGSTVAVYLRRLGLHAVVWSRLLSNCHEPEEKSLISNTLNDARVFAHMVL